MEKFQENITCQTDRTINKNLSHFILDKQNICLRIGKEYTLQLFSKNLDLYDQSDKNNFRKENNRSVTLRKLRYYYHE